jgi:hypothetical protein
MLKKGTSKAVILIVSIIFLAVGCSDSTKVDTVEKKDLKGVIIFQVGSVTIKKSGTSSFTPVAISNIVEVGDVIKTGTNAQVTIQVEELAVVKILEKSTVNIKSLFGGGKGQLYTEDGQVLTKMGKLVKDQSFSVQTPTAVASVRGTEFLVDARKKKSVFAVKSGKLAVRMKKEPVAGSSTEKESFVGEEVVLNEGKAAEVTKKDVEKAVAQEKKIEALKKEGKKEELAKVEQPKVLVRNISNSEKLIVKKVSIVIMVDNPEEKSAKELETIQAPIRKQEKKIEVEIRIEVKKEKIHKLINKKSRTVQEIKEVFDRVDEISLYNGRTIRGAIMKRGRIYSILTTTGTLKVPEGQIKSVRVVR